MYTNNHVTCNKSRPRLYNPQADMNKAYYYANNSLQSSTFLHVYDCRLSSCIRIITARVRSTREGNFYTWECLSVHHCGGGGYPIPGLWGVPHLRSGGSGGYPILEGGYPIPGLARGVPYPRSGWGDTPSQVQGGTQGTPQPVLDEVSPWTWDGVPPDLGWGNPPPA